MAGHYQLSQPEDITAALVSSRPNSNQAGQQPSNLLPPSKPLTPNPSNQKSNRSPQAHPNDHHDQHHHSQICVAVTTGSCHTVETINSY